MVSSTSIPFHRGTLEQGLYLLREGHPAGQPAKDFIEQRQFFDLKDASEIPLRNRSNKLYEIILPGFEAPLYLKVMWCNPDYSWSRRLNYRVRQVFRDNAFKAFHGSLAMEAAGLETLRAVACWRCLRKSMTWESYFLYEPVQAEQSVKELRTTGSREAYEQTLDEMGQYLQRLFRHGLRHYDLALGNWMVTDRGLALIDTDSVKHTRLRVPGLKTFFDLACFKRLNLSEEEERRVLQQCLGEAYREGWWKVHRFWRFGLWRRLRGKKPRATT